MQNKDNRRFSKKQGAILIASLCLVAAAGFTTLYTVQSVQKAREESEEQARLNEEIKAKEAQERQEALDELAKAEEEADNAQEVNAEDAQAELDASAVNDMDVDPASLLTDEEETEEGTEAESAGSSNVEASVDNIAEPTVNYTEDTPLTWPAAGTLLMDYSMNSTVYFETLDQYKYNPALIISSEVGTKVIASAKGIVSSITVEDETGTTLTLNLGNNYELVYGQLKEVAVQEGDVVEAGAVLGYVSEPTQYYCEEGSNLYFEMKKDGEPVDPFLYLE